MIIQLKLIVIIFLSFILYACGGESDDDSNPEDTTGLAYISGVWLVSASIEDLVDEIYFEFSESGFLSVYNYLGDSSDLGANCYIIGENVEEVTHLGDNYFTIGDVDSDDEDTATFQASRNGDSLFLEYSDGGIIELTLSSLSLTDIRTMECDDAESIGNPNNSRFLRFE